MTHDEKINKLIDATATIAQVVANNMLYGKDHTILYQLAEELRNFKNIENAKTTE